MDEPANTSVLSGISDKSIVLRNNGLWTGNTSGVDLDKLRELIHKFGLDPNSSDYDMRTALHLASERGRATVVGALSDAGARVREGPGFLAVRTSYGRQKI